jgi:hypothetical protein
VITAESGVDAEILFLVFQVPFHQVRQRLVGDLCCHNGTDVVFIQRKALRSDIPGSVNYITVIREE